MKGILYGTKKLSTQQCFGIKSKHDDVILCFGELLFTAGSRLVRFDVLFHQDWLAFRGCLKQIIIKRSPLSPNLRKNCGSLARHRQICELVGNRENGGKIAFRNIAIFCKD